MNKLTHNEAIALYNWAVENHSKNWGVWSNYPILGCAYLQYDNNPIIIKFDTLMSYEGETFKRIGWGRRIPGKEPAITFAGLYSLIPDAAKPDIKVF